MKAKAPGLKRYEELRNQLREDMLKVTELEYIYAATKEDLERLRLSEKFMLDDSFEGRFEGGRQRQMNATGGSHGAFGMLGMAMS